ncbi:PLP-dependent aminotransferase family protein [Leucobacter albus]|uniref:PLP-dependent aminotransferase family protein n=1 Tax=Leucobacter albus TaxID=272210 RepID=A0ABW3TQ06_9MICO
MLIAELQERLAGDGERYKILTTTVHELVQNGRLRPGERLPAERELAREVGVSRTTVVRAYAALEALGSLERRVGSGSYVTRRDESDAPRMADLMTGPIEVVPPRARGLINLSISTPPIPLELPAAIHSVVAEVFARARFATQHIEGDPELRQWVADWYTGRGLDTDPGQILITAGAQQALAMSTKVVRPSVSSFVVEAPTYLGFLDLARMRSSRVLSVPALFDEEHIRQAHAVLAAEDSPLLYAMTACHTVTGHAMPEHDKELLASLLHRTGGMVIDDDTLADELLDGPPGAPLAAFLDERQIITIGSTSKSLWDGLRVGWIRAPKHLARDLARMKSAYDLGTPVLSQLVALELLRGSVATAEKRRRDSRRGLTTATAFIADRMPNWRWFTPAGGRSLWVQLPPGSDGSRLAADALAHGVAIASGETFTNNDTHRDHIRVGFVQPPGELREGLSRLATAWAARR